MPLFAWALVLMVASYVITSLTVKPQSGQKPAALEDFDFPQAEEGTPHPVIFGDVWLSGPMVLWYGNMRTKKIKSKGGKKG
jgi:hypothetical protein